MISTIVFLHELLDGFRVVNLIQNLDISFGVIGSKCWQFIGMDVSGEIIFVQIENEIGDLYPLVVFLPPWLEVVLYCLHGEVVSPVKIYIANYHLFVVGLLAELIVNDSLELLPIDSGDASVEGILNPTSWRIILIILFVIVTFNLFIGSPEIGSFQAI